MSDWGKVLVSTWPVEADTTERWPSNRTRVRPVPSERRFSALMPAAPLDSEPEELAAVVEPRTEGRVFTKSAILAGASALISSVPRTFTGVGAS